MITRSQREIKPATRKAAILAALICGSWFFPARAGAQKSDGLNDLLSRTEAGVEQFVGQFAYMRYEEDIIQEKMKSDDRVEYKRETIYDSLLMTRFEDGHLHVEEQRLLEQAPHRPEPRPLLKTDGFSTLAMIFHPYYQSSFRFTRLEDDTLDGQMLARIGFAHIPGTPAPILYQMIYAERPLELSGTAWIDPSNGNIHRIVVAVGSSMTDMGLKALQAEILYAPAVLKDESETMWLPASATIDLETPKQHWRNLHHFGNYKKYRTDIKLDTDVFPSR